MSTRWCSCLPGPRRAGEAVQWREFDSMNIADMEMQDEPAPVTGRRVTNALPGQGKEGDDWVERERLRVFGPWTDPERRVGKYLMPIA